MSELELRELSKGLVHTVWRCATRKYKTVKAHQNSMETCVDIVYDLLKNWKPHPSRGEEEK